MRRLLFAFAGFALIAVSAARASAPPPPRYQLDFDFQRHGRSVCQSRLVAEAGTWYVACGLSSSANPVTQIRLHVAPVEGSPGQNHVRSLFEEIDPQNGQVKVLSNAMVAVLDGETSSVAQSGFDEEGLEVPLLAFEVKVTPL